MKLAVETDNHNTENNEVTATSETPATTHEATQVVAATKEGGIAAGAAALGLDGKLLAAQIVNFVILLLVLRKFLYKPLLGLLEQRKNAIEESLSKAEKIEKQFADFQVEHEKRIEESKKEAAAIVEQARKASEEFRVESLQTTQAETERMLTKAKEEIERQKQTMLNELKQEVGGLVVSLTGKLVGKELDAKQQSQFIDEAIREVGK